MHRLIPILLIVLTASCAGTSPRNTSTQTTAGTKNTPSYVVIKFLDAFVKTDFGTAYKYIHSNATDKQGYVSRMETLVEKSKNKITNYKLIGTRIIGDIAYAVVELEIEEHLGGGSTNIRYTKNQYELSKIEGKWKIVKDHGCVENCTDKKG
ncbi:MAG: DUF4878 domain-containing protein [Phycisphaerae bacterium]|nr:DUF4878 domain-containing protein [Phycisphaerae bacterium]NIU11127.1 DUF4878 domain-containing protein [Phycisphaerae bacterium]NIX01234.1 DUF4878 domain-containing protein [Phycisphaerae bacterium]